MGRTSKNFTAETVEAAIKKLNEMPEKPKEDVGLSTIEALAMLKPAVKAMQAKGYAMNEILAEIRTVGLDIGLTTLKNFVTKPKRKPKQQDEAGSQQNSGNVQPKATPAAKPQRAPAFQDPDEK